MRVFKDPQGDIYSVLIISSSGVLLRLKAPFKVRCIVPIRSLRVNTIIYVDAVVGSETGEIVYIIFEQAYNHSHFVIVWNH